MQHLLRGSAKPKLAVSEPHDLDEREADRVADQIMRAERASPTGGSLGAANAGYQRNEMLRRKETSGGAASPRSPTQSRVAGAQGGGHPLPPTTRAFFEDRFGSEFSDVRIHTGRDAAVAAQSLAAEAFTTGSDISFAPGRYAPESDRGRHLLAHELAHVVQQRATGRTAIQRRSADDATRSSLTEGYVASLSDKEIDEQIQAVVAHAKAVGAASMEYPTLLENLELLLQEREKRAATKKPAGSSLIRSMIEWQGAGLLDPPYRPASVAEIPPLPVTQAQAAKLGPLPVALGGLAAPKLVPEPVPVAPTRPPLRLVPPPEPVTPTPPAPEPFEVPAAVPIIAFLAVLLWPSETAPPWMDEINPVSGEPYGSPEEYDWARRLSPEQQDYLRRLYRWRHVTPNPAEDAEPDPTDVPVPVPRPKPREEDEPEPCISKDVPRKGGYARHDAYATKVTGSTFDYYVRTPVSLAINYDGLRKPVLVSEVKVGHGWFFNPDYSSLRDLTLAKWDAQKNLGLAVAAACGYLHFWSIPDKWIAELLNNRWGGVPAVLSIPE